MKTIKITLLALLITSCTKEWDCTITTTSELGTWVHSYELEGDTEDKNTFEDNGTINTGDLIQETNCVPK